VGTSASSRYPNWYAPLVQYVSYGVDQAECVVEGIRWLERQMDDFAHVQTEMQASIDSHTSMMLKYCKDLSLGGVGCPGMSPCLSHFIPSFSSYLVTCFVSCTAAVIMSTSMDCFH
jgi:hypothetical protein